MLEARDAALAEMRAALADADAALEEKEAVIEALRERVAIFEGIVSRLQAEIGEAAAQVNEKEAGIKRLTNQVNEKEAAIKRLTKALEKKQAVLNDLRHAVMAYRATFAVFGFLIHPAHWLVLTTRGAFRHSRRLLTPRLGVLSQHAPQPIALPDHYCHPIALRSPPRMAIVTPSFGQAAFIERTIRSILDQGYSDLEYVVQDGGSEDGTRAILERYTQRLSWDSRPDSGQAEAINRGFARTSGEIMAWLNSDDILFPGTLAYIADYFARHPEVDVVYGHRIVIDENDQEIGRWMMPAHSDAVLSWADFIPQETMFFRRRIWEKAGGRIDESFRFALDWDLIVRFRDAGARFARLPRFLGGFRIHAQQKTSAAISDVGFQEMNRIRERELGRIPSGLEVRKAVLPYLLKHVATDLGWRIQSKLGFHS